MIHGICCGPKRLSTLFLPLTAGFALGSLAYFFAHRAQYAAHSHTLTIPRGNQNLIYRHLGEGAREQPQGVYGEAEAKGGRAAGRDRADRLVLRPTKAQLRRAQEGKGGGRTVRSFSRCGRDAR